VPLPPTFPDLAALDLFQSVIQLGSLSRAAEAHGITQPSASSRIRHLERQLGMALLERSPTGSRPTEDGSVVAGWAASVLTAAEALATGVAALNAEASGVLRIAASLTVAEYLLPQWLELFLRTRKDHSVSLEVVNSAVVIERLQAGAVEIGFIESPGSVNLHQRTVAEDELVVVAAPGHPWASAGRVPVEALISTPLVVREAGSGTRDAFEQRLADLGFDHPIAALELGSTSAVRATAIRGSHPTVISRLAVSADLDAGSLVEIFVAGLTIERELRVVWSKRTAPSTLAQEFLDQLPSQRRAL
jgi:DNA-binding transcriptional LysR family regulator